MTHHFDFLHWWIKLTAKMHLCNSGFLCNTLLLTKTHSYIYKYKCDYTCLCQQHWAQTAVQVCSFKNILITFTLHWHNFCAVSFWFLWEQTTTDLGGELCRSWPHPVTKLCFGSAMPFCCWQKQFQICSCHFSLYENTEYVAEKNLYGRSMEENLYSMWLH